MRGYRSVWVVKEGMESNDLVKEFSGYDFYGFLTRRQQITAAAEVLTLLRGLK